MNRTGMMVDLSHTSPAVMHQALDESKAPVIWSHAAARALVDHPRNVLDDVLERLPANDCVVMLTFVPSFLSKAVWDMEEEQLAKRQPSEAWPRTVDTLFFRPRLRPWTDRRRGWRDATRRQDSDFEEAPI